jgi:hypothetical protein
MEEQMQQEVCECSGGSFSVPAPLAAFVRLGLQHHSCDVKEEPCQREYRYSVIKEPFGLEVDVVLPGC